MPRKEISQQWRSRSCWVGWWRHMSGTKKGGKELCSIVWQQVIICREELPRAISQATQTCQARRGKEPRVCLPTKARTPLSRGYQNTTVQSTPLPSLGLRSPGVWQRNHWGFWDFSALMVGQGYHYYREARSHGLPTVTAAWSEIILPQPDRATASHIPLYL